MTLTLYIYIYIYNTIRFFICSTSMSLEEVGTVLYHGVFASFFGGWVPIRSRSLNLIVFHLYIFLSLLILPLLMLLVIIFLVCTV